MSVLYMSGEEEQAKGPAAPVVIPPAVAAAMCEWRYVTSEVDLTQLTKPITYLVTAEGVRVARRTPVGVCIEPLVGEPHVALPLQKVSCGLALSIPRVPWEHLRSIVAFFREVANKHKAEALVRIYRHRTTGEWVLKVPAQDVSGGSVKVDDLWSFDDEGAYVHVMDIHSHVNMSPFFSGTDDADEQRAVRLYGVIGKISSPQPESSWRMWTGSQFLALKLTDVIEVPTTQFSVPVKRSLGELLMSGAKKVEVDLGTLDPFSGATFPAEWMAALETERQVAGGQGIITYGTTPNLWDRRWSEGGGGGHPFASRYDDRPSWRDGFVSGNGVVPGGRLDMVLEAKNFARTNPRKLVYVVNGDNVTRVLNTGDVKKTKMDYKSLLRLTTQRGVANFRIFDLTAAAFGSGQED